MTLKEVVLLGLVVLFAFSTTWVVASKSGAAHERLKILQERYIIDLQISEYQNKIKENHVPRKNHPTKIKR